MAKTPKPILDKLAVIRKIIKGKTGQLILVRELQRRKIWSTALASNSLINPYDGECTEERLEIGILKSDKILRPLEYLYEFDTGNHAFNRRFWGQITICDRNIWLPSLATLDLNKTYVPPGFDQYDYKNQKETIIIAGDAELQAWIINQKLERADQISIRKYALNMADIQIICQRLGKPISIPEVDMLLSENRQGLDENLWRHILAIKDLQEKINRLEELKDDRDFYNPYTIASIKEKLEEEKRNIRLILHQYADGVLSLGPLPHIQRLIENNVILLPIWTELEKELQI